MPTVSTDPASSGIRLQKVLAAAGLGSRRACEEMIADGRVRVDGHVVRVQGMRVDPAVAVVEVDGRRVNVRSDLVYLAFHKPPGVLSAMSDDRDRPTLAGYVADLPDRVFHVGRLDFETEGLLLLTNDGELAHRLAHPSFGVRKTYLADVEGLVGRDATRRLRTGVVLEDGPVTVDRFRVLESAGGRSLVEVVLHEGRKHVVRRLLAEVGHPVVRLVRTRYGPIALGDLKPGHRRPLGQDEIGELYRLTN
jgi:23S rRNA pseudouridine2605 synthase